jgi:Ca2+-binding EF-hand superfamily protein
LKELRAALKIVGFDLPGHEVRVLEDELKKSDLNRDGKLSLNEFQHVSERPKSIALCLCLIPHDR